MPASPTVLADVTDTQANLRARDSGVRASGGFRSSTPLFLAKKYTRLLTARRRDYRGALALLDEMRAAGVAPNVYHYNAVISACEKGGQWQRALALLDEMRAVGVAPDVITFNAAISKGRLH